MYYAWRFGVARQLIFTRFSISPGLFLVCDALSLNLIVTLVTHLSIMFFPKLLLGSNV